jgi:vancomycin resistance protein VanW
MASVKVYRGVRWLKARLLLDDLKSFYRGWLFRIISSRKVKEPRDLSGWKPISESTIQMKWREEMKEVNYSRFHNMKTGCDLVHGVLLKPNDVFSLRRFLYDASEAQGFQTGPVFSNGNITYSSGGGVCVVASILFDAVFKANLTILEKHNHSTDLWGEERFIHLGGDATYVYGRKDLKFVNSHTSDILIQASFNMESLTLSCQILSPKPLDCSVRVETQILEEKHPTANDNKSLDEAPYRKGWVVLTKRISQTPNGPEHITYEKKEVYKPFWLTG